MMQRWHLSHLSHVPPSTCLPPCHVQSLRTIYDEYNDEEITLTKEELRMIMAIRKGQFPSVEVNPFEPYVDW